jgi:hypothetical protein
MNRGRCWVAGLALALAAGGAVADDPKPVVDPKAFDKQVVDSLKEVHNRGADLYNVGKDFAGAYRMYEGGLLAVRPLLGHRPDEQKAIDEGLSAADKEPDVARKAFMLHETIEKVRTGLRAPPAESKKPGESKKAAGVVPEPKKSPEAAPTPKAKDPGDTAKAKAGGGPGLRGRVTFQGKPLDAGEVTFVSLDQPKPRVFTAKIQADSQYALMEVVPPGKYVVTVTGKGVPEKYQTTTTSGLRVEVQPPPFVFDIELR